MTDSPLRVLILADELIATRERELIVRLEIGLADEGVRVAYAVPRAAVEAQTAAGRSAADLFAQALVYEPRGMPWGRRHRLEELLDSLAALPGAGDGRPVAVVHAFGQGAWAMAIDLARRTGAGLVISVWSTEIARAAARLRLPSTQDNPPLAPLFLVPDPLLERRLRAELESAALADAGVRVAPWGVHSHAAPRDLLRPGRVVSLVMGGGGSDAAAYAAALDGIARLAGRSEELMVFADAEVATRAGLMPHVKRLHLTDRFTLVPEVEARRELALAADLLILPEALGEHRSLTLDAMAAGLIVVALEDPMVTHLIQGRTARLVPRPDPGLWSEAIGGLLDNRAAARALADSARDYVRQNHRASTQVAAILDAYEWLTGRESIPFEPPTQA